MMVNGMLDLAIVRMNIANNQFNVIKNRWHEELFFLKNEKLADLNFISGEN